MLFDWLKERTRDKRRITSHRGRRKWSRLGIEQLEDRLTPSGTISTVAGNGSEGFSGNGGAAITAALDTPDAVAFDHSGNLYIADTLNNVVRKVNATTGIITTFAGGGNPQDSLGDGLPATEASLLAPRAVAVDSHGNVFIADSGDSVVREVNATTGIITTFAGNGLAGYSGDGGAATAAEIGEPVGLAVDSHDNIYISDVDYNVVRKVNTSGIISTVAGKGNAGYSGDGGPATAAQMFDIGQVAVDSSGNLFIADSGNQRVREVNATTGIITTIAGNGKIGSSGNSGPATAAEFASPSGLAVDAAGNVYIADDYNADIREVNKSTGIITAFAGNGTTGFGGDGGPATAAKMSFFFSDLEMAFDSTGNLFFADADNNRIREVTAAPSTAPAVSLQPKSLTVSPGHTATFTASAIGSPAPTVQWQVSTNGGQSFTNISGATATTYTTGALTLANNGQQYRAVFTTGSAHAVSDAAVVTVRPVPVVTLQPVSQTANNGAHVTFKGAATGTPTPAVQWEVSTNGGKYYTNVKGATTTTLTVTASGLTNGNEYRVVFSNVIGAADSNGAILTVKNFAPTIRTQPVSVSVHSGQTVKFVVVATADPVATVQWQVANAGSSTFTNITGATSTTLSIVATAADNGKKYRAVLKNKFGVTNSTAVTLTIL